MNSILSSILGTKNKLINLNSHDFEKQFSDDKNSVLLDVRTPMENAEERIPNSILIDLYSPNFAKEIEKLDKTKSYYIYCRSGNRSYHAGRQMINMGFEKIYNLESGIIGWHGEVESEY
ncbi:MAG: rhodanese-like domain-containing protein [Bacteroidetes bacterium]|nr:rhodanese-like domain-containing protein [Bacteroidota bacterium]